MVKSKKTGTYTQEQAIETDINNVRQLQQQNKEI